MINTDRLCPACMSDTDGEIICPVCGADTSEHNGEDFLSAKTVLKDRYVIGRPKSRNGEGVTYVGWDSKTEITVSIREYFPESFAIRNADKSVSMIRGGEYTFNEGLMEFIDISRQINGSELPALIPVIDAFEENGTVYSVSQNISSITLKEFLMKNGGSLKWEQARPLFLPLIDTLKGMNDLGLIHGGISTDTILVGRDGKLRISDYAVRKLRYDGNELNSELFEGFAAIEQYDTNDFSLSEASDVYALCSVLFNVLIGTTPVAATERLQNDSMTIPSRFAEELPRHVLSALANGLQVLPTNRTADIETFKNELVYAETADNKPKNRRVAQKEPVREQREEKKGGTAKYVILSAVCTAAVFLIVVGILVLTVFKDSVFKPASSAQSSNDSISAPSVASIGAIDSGAGESVVLYKVPNLLGKYYAELSDNEDYEKFEFVIKAKEFNDKYPRGQICVQSVAQDTEVVRDTKIEVTISLGSKEVKIANVLGHKEQEAKLELLKQGFLYDNIEVLEKYDEDKEPGSVIEQEPKYGTQVSPDTAVKIYINSYAPEDTSSNDSAN